jgi:hypothetical protein
VHEDRGWQRSRRVVGDLNDGGQASIVAPQLQRLIVARD